MKSQTNEEIFCVNGVEDLILLKRPYYSKKSTDSTQSQSKSQWQFFFRNRKKKKATLKFTWNLKGSTRAKTILKRLTKLEASHFLISKYIIKLQYGTGIKTSVSTKGTEQRAQK